MAASADPTITWEQVAAIATAISVTASLIISVLWRFVDQRRASWAFFDERAQWDSVYSPGVKSGPPTVFVTLANTGDGDAFRVNLVGLACRVWPETDVYKQWLAGARPNDKILPRIGSGVSTAVVVVAEPESWDEASIAVIWTASPTWLGRFSRRAHYVKLASLSPLPRFGRKTYDGDTGVSGREDLPEPSGPLLDLDSQPRFPARHGWSHPIQRLRLGHRVRHFV